MVSTKTKDKLNRAVWDYTTLTTLRAMASTMQTAANSLKHESGRIQSKDEYEAVTRAVQMLDDAAGDALVEIQRAWHKAGKALADASKLAL